MAEMNPQRLAFKENYCNPSSETFGNIRQSALKAGFSESYSETLMSNSVDNDWVKEIIKDYQMLSKAENRLNEAMDIPVNDEKLGERSLKASMFVAETLGKQKYSKRNEHTGPDGKELPKPLLAYVISSNNSNQENNGTNKENQSGAGGNISEQDNINSPLLDTLRTE